MITILAILCLCVAVQAQTREQEICRQENETCRRNERRLGVQNDVSTTFNNHCRRQSGIRNWRNVSRCELSLATCRCKYLIWNNYISYKNIIFYYQTTIDLTVTLERCAVINCKNVRNSIDGGVTARPPTSRRTTRRILTPDDLELLVGPQLPVVLQLLDLLVELHVVVLQQLELLEELHVVVRQLLELRLVDLLKNNS